MENKDYRESIGKKLAQALTEDDFADLEDLIEMPSRETFDKWVEEVDQRVEKKLRRRKMLSMCAIFVIVVALVAFGIAIKGFAVPEVEADPDDKRSIDSSMETTATYTAWSELPDDIKEQFIEFTAFPEGYEVESVEVEEFMKFTKVSTTAINGKDTLRIRQIIYKDGSLDSNLVATDGEATMWGDIEVNVDVYDEFVTETTYNYVMNNIVVDITVTPTVEEEDVKTLVEKAAF